MSGGRILVASSEVRVSTAARASRFARSHPSARVAWVANAGDLLFEAGDDHGSARHDVLIVDARACSLGPEVLLWLHIEGFHGALLALVDTGSRQALAAAELAEAASVIAFDPAREDDDDARLFAAIDDALSELYADGDPRWLPSRTAHLRFDPLRAIL